MVCLLPDFDRVDIDDPVCIVGSMVVFDERHEMHLLRSLPGELPFHFRGNLPFGHKTYSLIDCALIRKKPVPLLCRSHDSGVLYHDEPTWESMHSLIELCSGCGALGFGALSSGFFPSVGVDCNSKMTDMWQGLHHQSVVCADICDPHTACKIFDVHPHVSPMSAGISCQPYSLLGDQRSSCDPRAQSLVGTLWLTHVLRSPLLVLECVLPAKDDVWVRSQLDEFSKLTGFHVREVELHLQSTWPCRRSRWWAVLSSPELGPMPLAPSTVWQDLTRVSHVIPRLCHWHLDDELALALDDVEQCAFQVHHESGCPFQLNMAGICPTAPHAWGSQLRACPCGCRNTGLSRSRLDSKGLFGVVVKSAPAQDGGFVWRHLHPSEAGALCGFDPTIELSSDPRLSLSAIGQLASPLQANWIFGQINVYLNRLHYNSVKQEPPIQHFAYRSWLLMKCRLTWPADPDTHVTDTMLKALEAWKPVAHLSLHQLMDLPCWKPLQTEPLSLAYIFDLCMRGELRALLDDFGIAHDCSSLPHSPTLTQVNVRLCHVSQDGMPAEFLVPAGSTVKALLDAECSLQNCDLEAFQAHSPSGLDFDLNTPITEPVDILVAMKPRAVTSRPLLMLMDGVVHEEDDVPCLPVFPGECGLLPRMPEQQVSSSMSSDAIAHVGSAHSGSPGFAQIHKGPDGANLWSLGIDDLFATCFGPCTVPELPRPSRLPAESVAQVSDPHLPMKSDAPVLADPAHADMTGPSRGGWGCGNDKAGEVPLRPMLMDSPFHADPDPTHCGTGPSRGLDSTMMSSGLGPVQSCPPDNAKVTAIVSHSPLVQLHVDSLMNLQAPKPVTIQQLDSLRTQMVSAADRSKILLNQSTAWADDELLWHLQQLVQSAHSMTKTGSILPIDPLLVHGWTSLDFHAFDTWFDQHFVDVAAVITVIYHQGHWIPFMLWSDLQLVHVRTWDVPTADHAFVDALASHFMRRLGKPLNHVRWHRMFCDTQCGAFAIAFLRHLLMNQPLPDLQSQLDLCHRELRDQFALALQMEHVAPKPWLWAQGAVDQAVQGLAPILLQQGVPGDSVDQRARAAVRAIGSGPILQALKAKTPWRQLKTVANQVKFQYLLPTELDAKIANSAGGAQIGKPKTNKRTKKQYAEPDQVELDPTKLILAPGTFQSQGHPLSQIQVHQLGPLAEGVAFARAMEVEPYLRSGQKVSQGPLAILLLHGPQERWSTSLPQTKVSVPCRCVANQEPLLVDCTLIQLGSGYVEKAVAAKSLHVDALEVCTAKFVIYRDEAEDTWDNIVAGKVCGFSVPNAHLMPERRLLLPMLAQLREVGHQGSDFGCVAQTAAS